MTRWSNFETAKLRGSVSGRKWVRRLPVGVGALVLVGSATGISLHVAGASSATTCSGPPGTAYVADAGYDAFSAVDTANCQVLATYNVDDPGNPGDPSNQNYSSTDEMVAVDGNQLYFADTGSSTVAVINDTDLTPSNESPAEDLIDVGLFPQGLAVSPDGNQVWVADTGPQTAEEWSSQVSIIDASTNSVVASIPVRGSAQQIAFAPNGSIAYVTTSQGLAVIDVSNRTVSDFVTGLQNPRGVAVSPDGNNVYVTDAGSNSVSVIDPVDYRVIGTIPVGELPWQIVFSPNGKNAYVSNPNSNSISVIDVSSRTVGSTFDVPGDPEALAVTSDGSELWVGEGASGSLEVLDAATGDQVGTIDLGTAYEPTDIALTP
jgi:phospholipase C